MKFSIVTPAYNMERWISRTIESVISQEGDFEIEYIIVDDGSIDNTLNIAADYASRLKDGCYPVRCQNVILKIISQKNAGMYAAINNGFSRASGDFYAWINADDTYESKAFQAITSVIAAFPDISWIKGITNTVDENWQKIRRGQCRLYRQDWIAQGIYGQEAYFIEQDSCFWSAALWKKIGGRIPEHYQSAGDYWLWIQFANHAPLWSLNASISNFMKRQGQISKNIKKYKSEQKEIRPRRSINAWKARLFFSPWSRLGCVFQPFFLWLYPLFFMRRPYEYIAIDNGRPIKRRANTFII